MGYWGKVIGGMAGFAMGGPFGAAIGAAIGHAADSGAASRLPFTFPFAGFGDPIANQTRVAALLGNKQHVFSLSVVALAAKLAKCDGPVKREEIAIFRQHFRVPDGQAQDIGRLFDLARETAEGYQVHAAQLGESFSDNRAMLEHVLAALFAIARADGPVNRAELGFLTNVHRAFGLDQSAWERASGARPAAAPGEPDPYEILGVPRSSDGKILRATWRRLMRENHPDALAARGVPPEFIAKANESVARINAAWDRIKRERGL